MKRSEERSARMPEWLRTRYLAVADELERTHGTSFADAFREDAGVISDPTEEGARPACNGS